MSALCQKPTNAVQQICAARRKEATWVNSPNSLELSLSHVTPRFRLNGAVRSHAWPTREKAA